MLKILLKIQVTVILCEQKDSCEQDFSRQINAGPSTPAVKALPADHAAVILFSLLVGMCARVIRTFLPLREVV